MAVGPDRVQVLKRESAALGGDGTEDVDYPQPINPQEDAIETAGVYLQDATNRDENVYVERHGGDMRFRDVANPTPVTLTTILGGGGLTEAAHEALDSLTHDLTETSFDDVSYDGSNNVTSVITWTTSAMTVKVREDVLAYDASNRASQIDTKQFASDGTTVTRHVREILVYGAGNRLEDITRTRVV